MEQKLTPELKHLKEEFDFTYKKIGELEWALATIFYGKKAICISEQDILRDQLDLYHENMQILLEKIKREVRNANTNIKK